MRRPWLLLPPSLLTLVAAQCPLYQQYSNDKHEPLSTGHWNLSYARPIPSCRTFVEPAVEREIERLRHVIVDPDLMRLFENAWPSTLDTTIAWRGYANRTDDIRNSTYTEEQGATSGQTSNPPEELAFVITGDISAMWLRDSAQQLLAYTSILTPSPSPTSLASLFRGAINLQTRYILESPFCNAFQAPLEASATHPRSSSANADSITPPFDYMSVFSCQWELDSLASFLSLSSSYFSATHDSAFFSRAGSNWTQAVEVVLDTAQSMMGGSYDDAGNWKHTPYTYCAPYGGTPINDCNGSPHKGGIGLVRSFHRPSDDACLYQYLVPSNMMFSVALNQSAAILDALAGRVKKRGYAALSQRMRKMSAGIRKGIEKYAVVHDPTFGRIYAYELDGYGSVNLMDDPNIPSLLSAPYIGYLSPTDPIYAATRRKILSRSNPYYAWGKVLSGVASPHTLPGRPWPMALVMAVLTSEDEEEIVRCLRDLVGSTDGLGLVHESVHAGNAGVWTRGWFSWANGLFGQMILDLEQRKPWILKMGFQQDSSE
ncbi:glycoside hydrolase family 125 protein [Lophiostoma macrostomum CBS 122681]|uniref:Glycoside hydrolase family 125 protein n=1 Tax=Lophiostoma macrostomum CBS 122681 TaxID=1314788 RepID=A0A6A6SPB5_9PLEO|nr:glycoside hydrolase family 125 protein [Lophiostoma macrostomum CBS 122681]